MTAIRTVRLVLWALVALAAVFAGLVWYQGRQGAMTLLPEAKLGAPFSLVDQRGQTITDADLAGKPYIVYFGFTHCPEVCPTTLADIQGWWAALGPDADRLHAYFVTVDPERDTPQLLDNYLSSFPMVTGISGEPDKVLALAAAWKIYWQKVPLSDGSYTMDHTASVFLVRPDGSLMGTIAYGEDDKTALAKLKRLAES